MRASRKAAPIARRGIFQSSQIRPETFAVLSVLLVLVLVLALVALALVLVPALLPLSPLASVSV